MKVSLYCLLLTAFLCTILATNELCTTTSDCSDHSRNKCNDMSKNLKELKNQELALKCLNGICMCSLNFVENSAVASKAITEMSGEGEKKPDKP